MKYIAEVEQRWNGLNERCAKIFGNAREKCKPMKNLLAYLDVVASESATLKPDKPVHEDFTNLAKYAVDIPKHLATLTELLQERDIDKLKKFDEAAATYEESLPKFEYLQHFSESALFTAYRAALLHDTERNFADDLTDENKQQYYRLKFRALNAARIQTNEDLSHSVTKKLDQLDQ